MEMKNYIEKGERRAGKQIELARILGVRDTTLRLAKSGKKGLPDDVCITLADYIEEDPLKIIAASNLVTEKDERKRKIFESCFEKTNRAASFLIAVILTAVISIMTLAPQQTVYANNISNDFTKIQIIGNCDGKIKSKICRNL